MKTDLIEKAIEHWRSNRGLGTALIPPPIDDKVFLLAVLQRMYAKRPNYPIMIITETFQERMDIIEYITTTDNEENNKEFKKLIDTKVLKIFTSNIIKNSVNYPTKFVILYHSKTLSNELVNFVLKCQFRLVIINKVLANANDMQQLYSIAPLLQDFKQNEIDEIRLSVPVEEVLVDVQLSDEGDDKKLIEYYDEYIRASLNIFGKFEKMKEANYGNQELNISSAEICEEIAKNNGWNEHLDMSLQYNVQIDEMYNPAQIRERASKTYEIIRLRTNFLANYKTKLPRILEIVENNMGKNILIINKNALFANEVANYINTIKDSNICAAYHSSLDTIPAVDEQGNPICFKSGERKGKQKTFGAQAQMTAIEKKYVEGKINIISTNNGVDKELSGKTDIVILTSPLCSDIESFIYRLTRMNWSDKIALFSLYVENSIEETKMANRVLNTSHEILNRENFNNKQINFSDIIVGD